MTPPEFSKDTVDLLTRFGYSVDSKTGVVARVVSGKPMSLPLVAEVVANQPIATDARRSSPWREKLSNFLQAVDDFETVDPREAGKDLQRWGLPIGAYGRQLVEPTGEASPLGRVLHRSIQRLHPPGSAVSADTLRGKIGRAGLLDAFRLFDAAIDEHSLKLHSLQFMERGSQVLGPSESDEALRLFPTPGISDSLARHRAALSARLDAETDPHRQGEYTDAIATIDNLARFRYEKRSGPLEVPVPGISSTSSGERPEVPSHGMLPKLLSLLGPLSEGQKQELILSFPLGEIIWNHRIDAIWEAGLRGAGQRVALLDMQPDRTREFGRALAPPTYAHPDAVNGEMDHGTVVSRVIHAVCPECRITPYGVINRGGGLIIDDGGTLLGRELERAEKDGNRFMNMSISSYEFAEGLLPEVIRRLGAARGVLVFASSGNSPSMAMPPPANIPLVFAVGSSDPFGKLSSFTTTKALKDVAEEQTRTNLAIKPLFLFQGEKIRVPKFEASTTVQGTSLAGPAITALSALLSPLLESRRSTSLPSDLSEQLMRLYQSTSRPVSNDRKPTHDTLAVDPYTAFLEAEKRRPWSPIPKEKNYSR
ncbi:MAG: S8/S53 family peptidase [Proteobacteria bacterium]|nr:S8/S53 family peptidase [Pseudomonadota bacterium]